MCGISGCYDLKEAGRVNPAWILPMRDRLRHRGPDDERLYITPNLALAFNRLSTVDIMHGQQPLWNEDRSLVLVANAEIFNHLELKKELLAKGHVFQTHSDCEVLLHLYEEEQEFFLEKLNGQFAFILYDFNKKRLFAARDHAGVAPFFYTITTDGYFIFASEIKAILTHPSVKKAVDLVGLDQILTFPGLVSPRTLFENIHSLPNGHFLTIQEGNVHVEEYWDLIYPQHSSMNPIENEHAFLEELTFHFDQAVRYRLRGDVPVGFYLSGGLDSALIARKAMSIQNQYRQTFSINVHGHELSEAKHQRLLADALQSTHQEYWFQPQDILSRLQQAVYHSECALKETYNTASLALSEMVRAAGLKVVLSGEGADECFAGYIGYRFDDQLQHHLPSDPNERRLRQRLWGHEGFTYEKNYTDFHWIKKQLYASSLKEKMDDFSSTNHWTIPLHRLNGLHLTHRRSYLDFKLRLCDHLVSDHGDRMGFAHGVECRFPFLDKALMEFSTRIPPHFLIKNYQEKYILKQMAQSMLPQEIIMRDKFAFATPSSSVLLASNNEYIHDLLSYERINREGYFDPDTIQELKKRYTQPGFRLQVPLEQDLLITVITFGMFLELFEIPSL